MKELLRRLAEESEVGEAGLSAAKARLEAPLSPEELKALLRALPEPDAAALGRARAGALDRLALPPRLPWRWPASAGALCLALGVAVWALWPAAERPLAGEVLAGESRPVDGLVLQAQGQGTLSGSDRDPVVAWGQGELAARLEGAGALRIETREARVELRGSAARVERDRLGTRVRVERGPVELLCLDLAEQSLLQDGDEQLCLPVSAAGLLGRSRALREAHRPDQEVLASVQRGLRLADQDPLSGVELWLLQAQVEVEQGDGVQALSSVRSGLSLADGQHPRWLDLHHLAASLALTLPDEQGGGCAGALPHLQALAPTRSDAAEHLSACTELLRKTTP